MNNNMEIDSDFPGGNIIVDSIDGDVVELRPDLRDTAGNWFYWSFAVRGAGDGMVTFRFGDYPVLAANGPAVSFDSGTTWSWLGAGAVKDNSFSYEFQEGVGEVRFCLAFPYLDSNLNEFLGAFVGNDRLKVESLCRSECGRDVELLRVGCVDSPPSFRMVITCRHHCCEMMANYVLEGFLRYILDDKSESARRLRDNVEFLVVPFVDKDGVEEGDQGKNRRPRDHNRDYGADSIYNSVKALKKRIPEWAGGKLDIALDMHCPYVKGGENESVYLVASAIDDIWSGQRRFSQILAETARDSLPHSPENNIPFGRGWNSSANFSAGKSFISWIAETYPEIKLATTIEIPYAKAGGVDVTPSNAAAFGANIAESVHKLLFSG